MTRTVTMPLCDLIERDNKLVAELNTAATAYEAYLDFKYYNRREDSDKGLKVEYDVTGAATNLRTDLVLEKKLENELVTGAAEVFNRVCMNGKATHHKLASLFDALSNAGEEARQSPGRVFDLVKYGLLQHKKAEAKDTSSSYKSTIPMRLRVS